MKKILYFVIIGIIAALLVVFPVMLIWNISEALTPAFAGAGFAKSFLLLILFVLAFLAIAAFSIFLAVFLIGRVRNRYKMMTRSFSVLSREEASRKSENFSAETNFTQCPFGFGGFVPGLGIPFIDYRALMSLTQKQNHVAFTGQGESFSDGQGAVRDKPKISLVPVKESGAAGGNFFKNGERVFPPRIFVGKDDRIRPFPGNPPLGGPFRSIPFPRGTENGDDLPPDAVP
jgi:hypothetical protein